MTDHKKNKSRTYIQQRVLLHLGRRASTHGGAQSQNENPQTGNETLQKVLEVTGALAPSIPILETWKKSSDSAALPFARNSDRDKAIEEIEGALKAQGHPPLTDKEKETIDAFEKDMYERGKAGNKDVDKSVLDALGKHGFMTGKDGRPGPKEHDKQDGGVSSGAYPQHGPDADARQNVPGAGKNDEVPQPPKVGVESQQNDRAGLGKEAAANQREQEAQKQAEPPLRPDIQKLQEEMLKPGRPVDDILLKKPEDWTEGEVRDVIKERIRLPMNNPERQALWQSEKKWFRHFYGDGNAKADEFGKIADPKPIRRMIDKPLDARTADGRPLSKEISRFSKHLSGAAGDVPAPELVKSLQSGLNTLGMSKRWNSKNAPGLAGGGRMLKEDGVFGPKTRGGLKTAMARLGRPKLEEGAALGRFNTFAASNRPRSFRDLRDTTERSFGPLFRNPGAVGLGSSPGKHEKLEATSLQETLNDLGPKHLGQGFTPLKLDGDIGPRTFDAFSRINKAAGPRSLTERFGSFLGFL